MACHEPTQRQEHQEFMTFTGKIVLVAGGTGGLVAP